MKIDGWMYKKAKYCYLIRIYNNVLIGSCFVKQYLRTQYTVCVLMCAMDCADLFRVGTP